MTSKNKPSTLGLFFKQHKAILFKNGQIILHPQQMEEDAYFLERGYVKAYEITPDGEEKLYVIYRPGELFRLRWIFLTDKTHLFYEALGPVTVKRISKEELLAFLKNNPNAFLELTGIIMEIFSTFVHRIDNLEITKAYPRLIARLISLVERFGEKQKRGYIITPPITHKDIANSINLARETASREFEKLERKGLVIYKNHHIVIQNLDHLKKELADHYERKPL